MRHERFAPICHHFYFLDYYIGKAFYLLLIAALILQHQDLLQFLIAVVILVAVALNIVHPCMLGSDPINGENVQIFLASTDSTLLKDLKKAEADEAKKRTVKAKDPENTAKVREELETEGKSIIDEKSVDMNKEKTAGKGTLKVRF